jgi:hypothetical protein
MIWRESHHLSHGILADGQLDRRYQQAPERGCEKAFLAIGGIQSQHPQTHKSVRCTDGIECCMDLSSFGQGMCRDPGRYKKGVLGLGPLWIFLHEVEAAHERDGENASHAPVPNLCTYPDTGTE